MDPSFHSWKGRKHWDDSIVCRMAVMVDTAVITRGCTILMNHRKMAPNQARVLELKSNTLGAVSLSRID